MDNMEHAIEHAARVLNAAYTDYLTRGAAGTFGEHMARALAGAGLLAPAPIREVRSRGTLNPRAGVLHFFGNDSAECVKCHTDWLPAERAEGDGSADQ